VKTRKIKKYSLFVFKKNDDLINYRREDKNGNTTAYNVLEDVNLTYSEIKNHTIEVEIITDCTAT